MLHAGQLYLLGRIIGMGLERPLVKRLSVDRDPTASVVLYVGGGELLFLALLGIQAMRQPGLLDGIESWLPLAILPGLLNAVCFFSFIRAMRVGEVSLLTPLFATGFVLMYIIDVAAGFAQLAWLPLAGVLLVTLGVVFLSPGPENGGPAWQRYDPRWLLKQPGALLMIANASAFACTRFFDKTLAPEAEPLAYAFVVNLPTVLIGLVILGIGTLRKSAADLGGMVRLAGERWGVLLVLVLFGQGAYLLLLLALDFYPPSVVEPVTQLGVFIAIALGGLWFKEPVRTRWLPGAMVVIGAGLLLL